MYSDFALRLMAELLWTGIQVCFPFLALTMAVGLLVSVFQVVTQIQEMSLTFVPKLITAGLGLIFFGPWMLQKITAFAAKLWLGIPGMF